MFCVQNSGQQIALVLLLAFLADHEQPGRFIRSGFGIRVAFRVCAFVVP